MDLNSVEEWAAVVVIVTAGVDLLLGIISSFRKDNPRAKVVLEREDETIIVEGDDLSVVVRQGIDSKPSRTKKPSRRKARKKK